MNHALRISLVVLALAVFSPMSTVCGQWITETFAHEIGLELNAAVDRSEIEGAVYLISLDGNTTTIGVTGDRGSHLSSGSIVRIYSMTKPITSVAAMILLERGNFSLDDPVAKFIPAFEKATVLEKNSEGYTRVKPKRPVTVRDVLRHTTGYSYGDEEQVKAFYERNKLRYRGPAEMFPPEMSIEQAAEAMAEIPALHHPGEQFTYGFSTDLLGRLIEVWSGKPLDQFMEQEIFKPLGMPDTGFSVPPSKRSRLADCHSFQDGKSFVIDSADESPFAEGFTFLSGGGGLLSTAQDYARFCQMLTNRGTLDGKRILSAETIDLMFTDQLNGIAGPFQFGLGFAIENVSVGASDKRRMSKQYSWGGFASTDFRIVPEYKLIQIVIRQRVPMAPEFNNQLISEAYREIQFTP